MSALVALLFAGGLVGLATVDSDDGDDAALTTVTSSTTTSTSALLTTSSAPSTTSLPLPTTTVAGSGLGTGGTPVVSGSEQTAETGAESLLWPGLGLLGLGLAFRRLRR